jgi:NAD(P)-dependent dehydrogenase (short-subunit alcohol dehydrogenase family)
MQTEKNNSRSLEGKKVVILGGSSGIGLATARAAAAEAAEVIIASGNQKRVDEALSSLPGSSKGFVVDLSQEKNIRVFFEQLGALDHLVYTAGENLNQQMIREADISESRNFFNLRYWGAYTSIKYAAPLIRPGGSISLISGTANARPGKGWSIASSVCGAVEALVRAMAVELAPIRVNSVVPGVIETNLWNSMSEKDKASFYQSIADTLLLGRVGQAEDVALAFVYLMKQSFGTGQNLVVDGGTLLV